MYKQMHFKLFLSFRSISWFIWRFTLQLSTGSKLRLQRSIARDFRIKFDDIHVSSDEADIGGDDVNLQHEAENNNEVSNYFHKNLLLIKDDEEEAEENVNGKRVLVEWNISLYWFFRVQTKKCLKELHVRIFYDNPILITTSVF